MTPRTCHAGRALLKWSRADLAREAGVGISTVNDFELERREVSDETVMKMKAALQVGGVEFTGTKHQPGLRLKVPR
jgi:transcriptional regulator with XRE-family HTH domain